jgi:hypothetical protein
MSLVNVLRKFFIKKKTYFFTCSTFIGLFSLMNSMFFKDQLISKSPFGFSNLLKKQRRISALASK